MSAERNSAKTEANAASDVPPEAPALPDQPDSQKSSGQKIDLEVLFKEAVERSQNMTDEEKLEKNSWMKNSPPRPTDAATAMRILEEMEREDAAAAWGEDGTATSADKAS